MEKKSVWECFQLGLKIGVAGVILIVVLAFAGVFKDKKVSHETPPAPPVEEKINYDMLQTLFLVIPPNITPEAIEKVIADNHLKYTRQVWGGSPRHITYQIAYTSGDAMQRYGTDGDHLQVVFNESDKKLLYMKYYRWASMAEAYYYAEPFTYDKKEYIGYVYHDYEMKQEERKRPPSYSNYYQEVSAESAMKRVLKHSRQ